MADQPDGRNCDNCRFGIEDAVVGDDGTSERVLFCQRHPPTCTPERNADPQFPCVGEDWWCGEYAPARPETVTDGMATVARLVLLGDLTGARALNDMLKE